MDDTKQKVIIMMLNIVPTMNSTPFKYLFICSKNDMKPISSILKL
jgi:hypothetical protein